MNVVDICPVGALTSRDFRFQARVWYLERTNSVCGGCATGCNIEIYHREGKIFRFQPRANMDVNAYWMCDAGRLSWRGLQGEGRLFEVLVRGEREFAPAEWSGAVASVSGRLREIVATHGPGAIGVVVSAQASNEEISLARRLGGAVGATVVGASWSPADRADDGFLVRADRNPNTQGLRLQGVGVETADIERTLAGVESGAVRALVLVRSDLTRWIDAERVRRALERAEFVVVLDSDGCEAAQYANVVLPVSTYAESDGTFTNAVGRVQRFHEAVAPPGQARAGWRVLGALLAAATDGEEPVSAAAVFDALAAESPAFHGLDYERVGAQGSSAANPRASA
jgi:NADH-quinone oxidoreductase subunit G